MASNTANKDTPKTTRSDQRTNQPLKRGPNPRLAALLAGLLLASTVTLPTLVPAAPGSQPGDSEEAWSQDAKLQADEPRPRELAGFDVELEGSIAVVGAPAFAANNQPGRVFVFEQGTNGWTQTATLTGDQGGDSFGRSVALEADTLVVGAPRGDTPDAGFAGGVYVYERTADGAWARTDVFAAEDSTLGDKFGSSVALDGDVLAVGAKEDKPNGIDREGSAYVFQRTDAGWEQQAKLVPDDPDQLARFGYDIDVEDGTVLVGVLSHDGQTIAGGTAFVFERRSTGWEQTAQLWPSDPGSFHRFGASVSLDGDQAAIGAPGQKWFDYPGAAYVFERQSSSTWTEVARVDGDDDPENTFGDSVQLSQDRLVVGARSADDLDYPERLPTLSHQGGLMGSGAVFVYDETGDGWQQTAKIMANDRGHLGPVSIDDGADPADWDWDSFGTSVALDANRLLVGAPQDDNDGGDAAGGTYLFTPGCPLLATPSSLSPPAPACAPPPDPAGVVP